MTLSRPGMMARSFYFVLCVANLRKNHDATTLMVIFLTFISSVFFS